MISDSSVTGCSSAVFSGEVCDLQFVKRSSRFCEDNLNAFHYSSRSIDPSYRYKLHNDNWRVCSESDIQQLNTLLLQETSETLCVSSLLKRFFPNACTTEHLTDIEISSQAESHDRGHPVVIEYSKARNSVLPSQHLVNFADSRNQVLSSTSNKATEKLNLSYNTKSINNSMKQESPSEKKKTIFEFSAGLCVARPRPTNKNEWEVLVIRREGDQSFLIPKGHVERGETLEAAAERELREESGILNPIRVGSPVLSEIYTVTYPNNLLRTEKTVHYFSAELEPYSLVPAGNSLWHHSAWFVNREIETLDVRWVNLEEATVLLWKSNTVAHVVRSVLKKYRSNA